MFTSSILPALPDRSPHFSSTAHPTSPQPLTPLLLNQTYQSAKLLFFFELHKIHTHFLTKNCTFPPHFCPLPIFGTAKETMSSYTRNHISKSLPRHNMTNTNSNKNTHLSVFLTYNQKAHFRRF